MRIAGTLTYLLPMGCSFILFQVLAVGSDHIFIPIKAIFSITFTFFGIIVGTVHIDKPIPLGDAVTGGKQVKGRPGIIAQYLCSVFNGSLHCFDVLSKVINLA